MTIITCLIPFTELPPHWNLEELRLTSSSVLYRLWGYECRTQKLPGPGSGKGDYPGPVIDITPGVPPPQNSIAVILSQTLASCPLPTSYSLLGH